MNREGKGDPSTPPRPNNDTLYIFPIHCSGEKIIKMVNKISDSRIKAFNTVVGTIFYFQD